MAEGVTLHLGNCLDVLKGMDAGSVDAVVTDPPYGLEFMGKEWDRLAGDWRTDISPDKTGRGSWFGDNGVAPRYHAGPKAQAWHQQWAVAALRVLKPGGYLLAFGGTRTFHRLACALEDAGFEIRDTLCWLYGSGFPKGKGCLKPAWEPILLARRPGPKVLPLGIDECRVGVTGGTKAVNFNRRWSGVSDGSGSKRNDIEEINAGRWPANVVHDGSAEVLEAFAAFGERCDTGTAARFFYCSKASRRERGEGNTHPTVKPLALMRWLVKLVAREGEKVLDPFAGSGSTLVACVQTGSVPVGIERDPGYFAIAERRIAEAQEKVETGLFSEVS